VLPHDYDRSLPQLPAYAGELNQVWTNLVDNAVDAIDGMDGRGRLTVRTARDGDQALVEIGDNGPGISAGAADHILEPFYTTKPVGRGTGLGLDICWRIVVQRHHGDLRFTSVPGDIRFQVLLPSSRTGEGAAPWAQAGSRRSPPWAAIAQITKTSRVMISSDQNG
jgi:signal transduction histidine kinase